MKAKTGFSLIEMLVATVLSAVLMSALLAVLAGVARDRRLLRAMTPTPPATGIDLLEWDVRNASTISSAADAPLILVGNDGIDRASLAPDGRLVRVVYRVVDKTLWRQQEYLDDPVRPMPWQELMSADFRSLSVNREGTKIRLGTATSDQAREVIR